MLIDKPAGPTSHDVVARVRRALGTREVGHAGTLDPFATGLLVLLIGRATRLARFVERLPKGYRTVVRLGQATDTDDATGRVIIERPLDPWPSEPEVRTGLESLAGVQRQRPPAYSARRVEGRRGYQLARAGVAVELPAREVTVYRVELMAGSQPSLLEFSAARYRPAPTFARWRATWSRAVRHGGALPRAPRREWIGPFLVVQATDPAAVGSGTPLLTPLRLVEGLQQVALAPGQAEQIGRGKTIPAESGRGGEAALVWQDRLVAVAERIGEQWQPRIVLEPA